MQSATSRNPDSIEKHNQLKYNNHDYILILIMLPYELSENNGKLIIKRMKILYTAK